MSHLKQCPQGHYYEGDTCPYCPTQLFPDYGGRTTDTLHTSVVPPNRETEIVNVPLCPHCRKPLRKHVPLPPKGICVSSIDCLGDGVVPWNYGWDGRCENCGHDFNFVMRIDMGSTGPDNRIRKTRVKVGAKSYLHHITCDWGDWRSTVLSGVEIETSCGSGRVGEKFFLSANEVKHLIKVLKDSPILKQLDYYSECKENETLDSRTTQ